MIENGHGHVSSDLTPKHNRTKTATQKEHLGSLLPIWWRRIRCATAPKRILDVCVWGGRHGIERKRARGSQSPRAWETVQGMCKWQQARSWLAESNRTHGPMDGIDDVSASRLMGGPPSLGYARPPVSTASHHFPSSQLLSHGGRTVLFKRAAHNQDSNAALFCCVCVCVSVVGDGAGRQRAGRQSVCG